MGQRDLRLHARALRALKGLELIRRVLSSAAVLDELVAHFLAVAQIAHAGPFDRADMDENVRPASVRLDEAKAFLRVKTISRCPVAIAASSSMFSEAPMGQEIDPCLEGSSTASHRSGYKSSGGKSMVEA